MTGSVIPIPIPYPPTGQLTLVEENLRQEEHWQWRREEHRLSPTERAFQSLAAALMRGIFSFFRCLYKHEGGRGLLEQRTSFVTPFWLVRI